MARSGVGGPRFAPRHLAGDEHLPHQGLAVGAEEHVLGPAQANALGTELARPGRVLRGVRVRPHSEAADLVGPAEHLQEVVVELRLDERDVVCRDDPGRPVDRDQVAAAEHGVTDPDRAGFEVDHHLGGPADAGPAHPARDDRSVGGLASLRGEDAAGRVEAADVVGGREGPDEDHVLAGLGALDRLAGLEDDHALRRTRRRGDAPGQLVDLGVGIEGGMHERDERRRIDLPQRLFTGEDALTVGVDGEADGGARMPLGIACLKDVEPPILDRVLDVLDVAVVTLEHDQRIEQGGMYLRHALLEACQGLRVAHPGDHVLALGVEQEVTISPRRPGGRIARERHARPGVLSHVAEDHPLHRHRGAELGRIRFSRR